MEQPEVTKMRNAYVSQKRSSIRRNIPFLFTFKDWCEVWLDSGHWYERGRNRGQYHMARNGDVGPYARENVQIILGDINRHDAITGKHFPPRSAEHRRKLSEAASARKRKPHSEETRRKMSLARTGRVNSEETRRRISLAKTGSKLNLSEEERERRRQWARIPISQEARAKISAAMKGTTAWENRERNKFGHFI